MSQTSETVHCVICGKEGRRRSPTEGPGGKWTSVPTKTVAMVHVCGDDMCQREFATLVQSGRR